MCKQILFNNTVNTFIPKPVEERISRVEVNISKNNVVEHKESVVLSCSFTGTHETVQWIKDNKAIEIKPGIELSNNNLSLHIRNASREHIVKYSCNASNAISYSISNSQHLNVYYSHLENGILSAGAIVGISIGVVVSLALILTVGAVLLKKFRMPDENRSNASNVRTYENFNVSNGLPIYENRLPDVHCQLLFNASKNSTIVILIPAKI
ncbi:carcinoembryonic antigen-related cell adhesion molecule 21-like [Protopterus annectens]|uniref:carcinoembryonic antigen-related cell adhesion molecule 21-like n=1 Tax=Protopterus annectens TaxID=7888 RepID=UPI001CF9E415|nr:carcinoembryonic antigen-related cell adhesion molecule 21-like [Protopterus annectens]